ncbi:hypothetical protein QQZ08_011843 [Neonectria magnoliae]|uniref:Uncharacterized protein n=1 Tax=Neonectria magnoliae TaxID=2732573 RepID=A0ABR1H7H0_9HYPO
MKLPYTLIAVYWASTTAALPATTTPATSTTTAAQGTPSPTNPTSGHLRPRQSSPEDDPPPYEAIVTAAPTQDAALASLGYYQTTYYECRTRGGKEHCGWHIPVLKDSAAAAVGRGGVWRAVCAVGVAWWIVM